MAGRREELDSIEDLLLVSSREGHKGYRRGLISQQLTQMEESLLVCGICTGILHKACNYANGQGMCCESCLGAGEAAQGIGAIRTMVSILRCKCPLGYKGCEWEGTIQGLWEHLDTCGYFVVSCPYGRYGCHVSLRRGQLEAHRLEGKEYHMELVMVHLGNQVEEQSGTIERLKKSVEALKSEREYYKKNEAIWKITQIEKIQAALQQPQQPQQPQQLQPLQQQNRFSQRAGYLPGCYANMEGQQQSLHVGGYSQLPNPSPNILNSPAFQLDSFTMMLHLERNQEDSLSLNLVNSQANLGYRSYQLAQKPQEACCRVKFKLTISNRINTGDDWVKEIGPLELKSTTQSLLLADIHPALLFSEEFSCDDTILLQLLYSVSNV